MCVASFKSSNEAEEKHVESLWTSMDVSHPFLLSSSLSKPLTFASVLDDDLRSVNDYSFRSLRYRESLFLLLAGLVFLTASFSP